MIRRDDGGDWLLIDQIQHARLAADIAREWGNERFKPLTRDVPTALADRANEKPDEDWRLARLAIQIAVARHDEGWGQWDWAPHVDPGTGRPRDFREMRMQDATAIWTRSIGACNPKLSPVSAYAVSRHFCYLAEQVRGSGRHDAEDLAAVTRFLQQKAAVRAKLESESARYGWQNVFLRHRELAYHAVQFFDRVSLWLCCAAEHEPQAMTAPLGEVVTFSCRSAARGETVANPDSPATVFRLQTARPDYRKWHVTIEPDPLFRSVQGGPHEFSVDARRVPARWYADDADLQTTWRDAPSVQLVWSFGRAEG
jgi:hypothetical protein